MTGVTLALVTGMALALVMGKLQSEKARAEVKVVERGWERGL